MKIKRLRLAGFGPYKDEQRVDFEVFDANGIFLITGKTGAGKSSILDAICFALYASVPRYDGRETQLRSDYCDPGEPTFVELEFSMGAHDYRIYREPSYERPSKRGGGTTRRAADARLEVFEPSGSGGVAPIGGGAVGLKGQAGAASGSWRGLAARPVDVGHEMERILPLKADQFLQVILLAQNRFQQFLLAKTDERRAVLRTLFQTSRFKALEESLAERNRALTAEVADARQHLRSVATQAASLVAPPLARSAPDPSSGARVAAVGGSSADAGDGPPTALLDAAARDEDVSIAAAVAVPESPDGPWFHALLELLERSDDAVALEAATAAAVFLDADSAYRSADDVRRRQQRRDDANLRLDALHQESPAVDEQRAAVVRARLAAQAWPQVDTRRTAEAALATAYVAEEAARVIWAGHLAETPLDALPAAEGSGTSSSEGLREALDELVGRRGALDEAITEEKLLPGLRRDGVRLDDAQTTAAGAVQLAAERAERVPVELDENARHRAEAAVTAAQLTAATEARDRIERAKGEAERAAALEPRLDAAVRAQATASSANVAAAARFDELLQRRLAGHAAELAAELVDGQHCSVCGSTEHPKPAVSDAEPVTDAAIEAARQNRTARQAALAEAETAAQGLAADLAAARARAGAATLPELAAQSQSAELDVQSARDAAQTVRELDAQRVLLVAERDSAQARLLEAQAELAEAQNAVLAHGTRVATLAARLEVLRAGHASVAGRAASIDTTIRAARALERALAATLQQQGRLESARTAEALQLADLGFADDLQVDDSRLGDRDLATVEARIRAHDDGLAGARSTLEDPELADLPSEAVDLTPLRVVRAEAEEARDSAAARRSSMGARLDQLVALVREATELLDASAALLSEQAHVRELAEVVEGKRSNTKRMRLETYVLAGQLEQIIAAANGRLGTMTGGRYSLELDDGVQYRNVESGLGLSIRDEHTGRARPTHSLSGGETFLASLALALGLAEIVSNQVGGIALDTLFVDEGFGSLDSETLDVAMSTLDSLRTGGRTIGLISHVDSMKEQIAAKLRVTVTPSGASRIEDVTPHPAP